MAAPATDTTAPNPLDQLISQYKQGYKTSEFWVVLLVGLAQALSSAFDKNQPLNHQLTNLTWVAITYILGRSGLKVARVTAQTRAIAKQATPAADASPAAVGAPTNGAAVVVGQDGSVQGVDPKLELALQVIRQLEASAAEEKQPAQP